MIDEALSLVAGRINAHLRARHAITDDLISLAPLTDAEGKPAATARNRLALFVTNIAQDPMPRHARGGPLGSGGIVTTAQPIHLDIYFMLAAAFEPDTYGEGLKILSSAVRYLQANPLMTRARVPDLPDGIGQLSIEISNLRNDELGQLWGNLGGRYLPSVHYKMRSVMIDANAVTGVEPLVREAAATARAGVEEPTE